MGKFYEKRKKFVEKAYYPGGSKAMDAYVSKHLKMPHEAIKQKVKGAIPMKLHIDPMGKVERVDFISKMGYGCDEEAERVVKMLQFKVPKNRNRNIRFQHTLHIHFDYRKYKKLRIEKIYQYELSSKTTESEKEGNSYSYSVTF